MLEKILNALGYLSQRQVYELKSSHQNDYETFKREVINRQKLMLSTSHSDNKNICDTCEERTDDYLVYDTGICSKCHRNMECKDKELLSLYRGIGFDDEFICAHLPRLRFTVSNVYTWEDIGKEISRHVIHGACNKLPSCQGYGLSARVKWSFKNRNNQNSDI